jgi:hypothetical protein
MKKSSSKVIWIIPAICCLVLLYPRQITLAPEVELTVFYDNGEIAKNVEVRRNWNSYAADSWKIDATNTDENGRVKFESVQRRIPIIWERLKYYLPAIQMHENNSNAGNFIAREPQNHFIWGRVDYLDENCCPTKIVMTKQNTELRDSLFNLGLDSE